MGLRQPKTLSDLKRWDAHLEVTCRSCRHAAIFDAGSMADFFHGMRWNTAWEEVPRRFRCGGCGAKDVKISLAPYPAQLAPPVPAPLARDLKAEAQRKR